MSFFAGRSQPPVLATAPGLCSAKWGAGGGGVSGWEGGGCRRQPHTVVPQDCRLLYMTGPGHVHPLTPCKSAPRAYDQHRRLGCRGATSSIVFDGRQRWREVYGDVCVQPVHQDAGHVD